jgi:hypothetical protein
MKKITAVAGLVLGSIVLAAPVHAADDPDSNFGGGVNATNNWNFTAAAVCLQEVAVVPVLGDYVSDHANNCSNGNVIDHAAITGKPSWRARDERHPAHVPAAPASASGPKRVTPNP